MAIPADSGESAAAYELSRVLVTDPGALEQLVDIHEQRASVRIVDK